MDSNECVITARARTTFISSTAFICTNMHKHYWIGSDVLLSSDWPSLGLFEVSESGSHKFTSAPVYFDCKFIQSLRSFQKKPGSSLTWQVDQTPAWSGACKISSHRLQLAYNLWGTIKVSRKEDDGSTRLGSLSAQKIVKLFESDSLLLTNPWRADEPQSPGRDSHSWIPWQLLLRLEVTFSRAWAMLAWGMCRAWLRKLATILPSLQEEFITFHLLPLTVLCQLLCPTIFWIDVLSQLCWGKKYSCNAKRYCICWIKQQSLTDERLMTGATVT